MDADEFRRRMAALPEPDRDGFWGERRGELRECVARDDLSNLLTWAVITSTMFVNEAPYIRDEYDTLMNLDADRWRRATRESDTGRPDRLSYDPDTSGNLIHQAYHLANWELATGKHVSRLGRIVEIGGGYGAMARVARKAGFTGEYVLVDSPEFSLLQEYYLTQCGIEASYATRISRHIQPDLLIALYSLSEMSDEQQQGILHRITPYGCLIGANANRKETHIDRIGDRLKARRLTLEQTSSYYVLG